jgi:hypothetical protein
MPDQKQGFDFGFGQQSAPQVQDNEPDQITRPSQYPTTTRIEDGVAYDIAGKKLGPVDEKQAASQPTQPFNFGFGEKHDFGFEKPAQPSYLAGEATGIGGRRQDSIWSSKGLDEWLDDVQGDLRTGQHSTFVGSLLSRLGYKGREYGVSEGAARMSAVGMIPEGLAKIGQSVPELFQGHPVRGFNKAVGGVMDVAAPAAVVQPEAMAVVIPAMMAANIASGVATKWGADEDTSEMIGNVAGLVAGGKHRRENQ